MNENATQIVEDDESDRKQLISSSSISDASVWGLDPLYWTYLILMNVQVVKGLIPTGNTWDEVNRERNRLRCNHSLPKSGRVVGHVQVLGTLVRKSTNSMVTTYTLDDGTALLDCVEWSNEEENEAKGFAIFDPPLGCTLRCFGKLEWPSPRFQTQFKTSVRRVVLTRPVCLVKSINEELRHWCMAMELWNGLYAQSFQLSVSSEAKRTNNADASAAKSFTFGGELEDAVMELIRQTHRMPLISSLNENAIRNKYNAFLRICFEIDSLLREEPISSILIRRAGGDREGAIQLLRNALKKLCTNGQILVMDSKMELFAVITHEDFLAPAILRALTRFQMPFISHKVLLEKLREDPRLHTVSNSRFDASLSRLLTDSCIVEGDVGMFGLLRKD